MLIEGISLPNFA